MDNCSSCGRQLEIGWCPYCEKPRLRLVEVLNLRRALRHIEVAYDRPEYEERVWDLLCDWDVIRGNSTMSWWYPRPDHFDPTSEISRDVELFIEVFNVTPGEGILLEISW